MSKQKIRKPKSKAGPAQRPSRPIASIYPGDLPPRRFGKKNARVSPGS